MNNNYNKNAGMGKRLRNIREEIGETQTAFAERFHLKRHDIANYERGRADLPSRLISDLNMLGYNVSWLVTGDGYIHKTDDLLHQFESLSKEFGKLTHRYEEAQEELMRVLAVAEPKSHKLAVRNRGASTKPTRKEPPPNS